MFCPNCGNQMKEGAVFCSNCGYRNDGSSSKGLNFNFNKIPFVPILCLVVIVIVALLVKNLFLSESSFKSIKLVTAYSEDTTIDNMETVKFGSYPQSDVSGNTKQPIEWIVLDRQDNRALLLSKYILDSRSYNDKYDEYCTWETCRLRNWINNDFYFRAFSSDEQKKILDTIVINDNIYGTNDVNNTSDKVFCLSVGEIRKYFGDGIKFVSSESRQLGKNVIARGTNYAKNVGLWVDSSGSGKGNSIFWLRSPGIYGGAMTVNNYAHLDVGGDEEINSNLGVRPAIWVTYE